MTRQSDREIKRRVEDALKRAFPMPHKPHELLKRKQKLTKGKGRIRAGKSGS